MPLIALLRFVFVLVVQIIAFFFFYNHPYGRHAVYDTWYAWIIDALAIMSGGVIMALSIYAITNPWIFTIDVPGWIFWFTFIVGGWQAAIHLVKWVVRWRR